jgi:hypothetical protein
VTTRVRVALLVLQLVAIVLGIWFGTVVWNAVS